MHTSEIAALARRPAATRSVRCGGCSPADSTGARSSRRPAGPRCRGRVPRHRSPRAPDDLPALEALDGARPLRLRAVDSQWHTASRPFTGRAGRPGASAAELRPREDQYLVQIRPVGSGGRAEPPSGLAVYSGRRSSVVLRGATSTGSPGRAGCRRTRRSDVVEERRRDHRPAAGQAAEPDVLGDVLRRDPLAVGHVPVAIRPRSRSRRATRRSTRSARSSIRSTATARKPCSPTSSGADDLRQVLVFTRTKICQPPRRTGSTASASTPSRSIATGPSRSGPAPSRPSRAASAGPRRDRCGGPRARYRGPAARRELRAALRPPGLHPPHRPDRSGRADRRCHLARLHRRGRPPAWRPAPPQAGHPVDRRGGLRARSGRRATTTGCPDGTRSDISRASRPPQGRPPACARRGRPEADRSRIGRAVRP